MDYNKLTIGFALTGSFCTFSKVFPEIEGLVKKGIKIIPIMSKNAKAIDTRFGKAEDFIKKFEEITSEKLLDSLTAVEPIGPKNLIDALIIAPCTGNTLSKLANGITDSVVTMAAKATIRNEKPVIIAVSTNDGLGFSAKNIGLLLNSKNIYIVPFLQDDPKNKHNSLVSKMDLIEETLIEALNGKQKQPLILGSEN